MSKQTNPAKLGIFVLAAIALGLGTLAVVSSGNLFKKTIPFVMYFEADATGLKPGAPVLYRGVSVGQVTKIQLVYNSDLQDMLVPVYIEIDPNRFVLEGSSGHYPVMEDLVKEGLRAKLQTQSFVTGMLQIALVNMPNIPIKLKGVDPDVREIPTAPALTQILSEEVKELDLTSIASDLQSTIKGITQITEHIQDEQIFKQTGDVLNNLQSLSQELSKTLPVLTEDFTQTSTSVRELVERGSTVLDHVDSILVSVDKKAPEILRGAEENSAKLIELQTALTSTIKHAEGIIEQDSPLRYNIAAALDRFSKVADSLEIFLDTLEKNPEAMITGKPPQP